MPETRGKRYPEWREGAWWRIQVRQKAIAAREKEVGWTQPFRLLFEVVGEEVVEGWPCPTGSRSLIRIGLPARSASTLIFGSLEMSGLC